MLVLTTDSKGPEADALPVREVGLRAVIESSQREPQAQVMMRCLDKVKQAWSKSSLLELTNLVKNQSRRWSNLLYTVSRMKLMPGGSSSYSMVAKGEMGGMSSSTELKNEE